MVPARQDRLEDDGHVAEQCSAGYLIGTIIDRPKGLLDGTAPWSAPGGGRHSCGFLSSTPPLWEKQDEELRP